MLNKHIERQSFINDRIAEIKRMRSRLLLGMFISNI